MAGSTWSASCYFSLSPLAAFSPAWHCSYPVPILTPTASRRNGLAETIDAANRRKDRNVRLICCDSRIRHLAGCLRDRQLAMDITARLRALDGGRTAYGASRHPTKRAGGAR